MNYVAVRIGKDCAGFNRIFIPLSKLPRKVLDTLPKKIRNNYFAKQPHSTLVINLDCCGSWSNIDDTPLDGVGFKMDCYIWDGLSCIG